MITAAHCHRCGRETEWDERMRTAPSCLTCWDRVMNSVEIDTDNAAYFGKPPPAEASKTIAIRGIIEERWPDFPPPRGSVVALAEETGASEPLVSQVIRRVMLERGMKW